MADTMGTRQAAYPGTVPSHDLARTLDTEDSPALRRLDEGRGDSTVSDENGGDWPQRVARRSPSPWSFPSLPMRVARADRAARLAPLHKARENRPPEKVRIREAGRHPAAALKREACGSLASSLQGDRTI
jgi:hypothetical protein